MKNGSTAPNTTARLAVFATALVLADSAAFATGAAVAGPAAPPPVAPAPAGTPGDMTSGMHGGVPGEGGHR